MDKRERVRGKALHGAVERGGDGDGLGAERGRRGVGGDDVGANAGVGADGDDGVGRGRRRTHGEAGDGLLADEPEALLRDRAALDQWERIGGSALDVCMAVAVYHTLQVVVCKLNELHAV